ncbi:MAG: nitrous oxide reductase accessory protein NosL [Thauera sp.]|nr:nitrous oxide reductase accessory protein NosL [Thauera sp.]
MTSRERRLVLINAAAVCAVAAGTLFWQHAQRPHTTAFEPPGEDMCIVPPTRASAAHAYDPASGLGLHDARPIPADARCAVCGMYPSRFPRWAAQLIFDDGRAHFFDSPVDLFLLLAEPARFDAQHRGEQAVALYVSDSRGGGWLDARRAVFVIGSRTRGPMRGPDLPAFADAASAEAFIAEQGGRAIGFDDITPTLLSTLRDQNHARHTH